MGAPASAYTKVLSYILWFDPQNKHSVLKKGHILSSLMIQKKKTKYVVIFTIMQHFLDHETKQSNAAPNCRADINPAPEL